MLFQHVNDEELVLHVHGGKYEEYGTPLIKQQGVIKKEKSIKS